MPSVRGRSNQSPSRVQLVMDQGVQKRALSSCDKPVQGSGFLAEEPTS